MNFETNIPVIKESVFLYKAAEVIFYLVEDERRVEYPNIKVQLTHKKEEILKKLRESRLFEKLKKNKQGDYSTYLEISEFEEILKNDLKPVLSEDEFKRLEKLTQKIEDSDIKKEIEIYTGDYMPS